MIFQQMIIVKGWHNYAAAAFQGFTIVISSLSLKPSLTWVHLQICTFSYGFLLGATYLLIVQCKSDEYCMKLSTTLKLGYQACCQWIYVYTIYM